MILQSLCRSAELDKNIYFNTQGRIEVSLDKFLMYKGARISTDTYFNSCTVGKWGAYCDIDKIALQVEYSGNVRIEVVHAHLVEGKCIFENLFVEKFFSPTRAKAIFQLPKKNGVVYFTVEALADNAVLYDACYTCEASKEHDITIALNICTYRRETFLLRNLELLKNNILNNEQSPLYGHLKVFITDNGNTLPLDDIQDSNVHVCYNPNVGGAGGFTRGLIEIDKRRYQEGITHVIFMDDDVEILPESIERTYNLLCLLKEEYQRAFISGAMLRLDMKYVQHENGALWNGGKCKFVNRGMDLRNFESVVRNEEQQERDYAAWWYCCMPISVISRNNLPIPIFIHEDDVEYSLRNAQTIITMNGIAVWHPVAEHIRISTNEYYNLRNLLIVNSRYCNEYGRKQVCKKVLTNMLMALLRYRYKDMHLIYRAVKDFCKGPDWLLQIDAVSYHQEIVQAGYQMQNMSADIVIDKITNSTNAELVSVKELVMRARQEGWLCKLIRQCLSLNGWLLPARSEKRSFYMSVHPFDMYRIGQAVLYDDASGKGIEVKRSFRQIFIFIALYVKALYLLLMKYNKSKKLYRERFQELCSEDYWNKVLEL